MGERLERAYVLDDREVSAALACAKYVVERERWPVARALVDELTRLVSKPGRFLPDDSDIDGGSQGITNGSALSVAEAAQLLHLSVRQTSRYLPPNGPLRAGRVGWPWVIERASVEEFAEQRRRTA